MNEISKIKCPYCENKLEKTPLRKTKCNHCGKYIYVRTRPLSGERYLIKEDEIKSIEREWEMWDFMNNEDPVPIIKELRLKFKKEPSLQDVVWAKFQNESNKLIIESNKDCHRLFELSRCYFQQLEFLKICKIDSEYVKKVKNTANEVMRKRYRSLDFKEFKKMDDQGYLEGIKILLCDDSCSYCQKYKNKIFTLKEILNNEPLPNSNCENGWCRCDYDPIYK